MTEAEPYFLYQEVYQYSQCGEIYQIEGEFLVVEHFVDQIIYEWDLDHDYCLDA